jgi:hypothetical protein
VVFGRCCAVLYVRPYLLLLRSVSSDEMMMMTLFPMELALPVV